MGTKYTIHNQLRELDFEDFGRDVDGMLDLDPERAYTEGTAQASAAVETLNIISNYGRRVASDLTVRARSAKKVAIVGIRDRKDAKELKEVIEGEPRKAIRSVELDKSLTGDKWALIVEDKPPGT